MQAHGLSYAAAQRFESVLTTSELLPQAQHWHAHPMIGLD